MLTADMKRIIEEQRLGFVATAAADGTPISDEIYNTIHRIGNGRKLTMK